ncbi:uncharacterized protein LOC135675241 [Musa acuminata AAA Group]|uniref:uncharacterized protein LOC135675241 n=1 Tax=Musa acuminata AAA Group TaxID=214697 RepID=UPI0031DD5DC5
MLRWSVELSEFDIQYSPRNAIKAQVLADFISELTPEDCADGRRDTDRAWTLHVDGSAITGAAGIDLVLRSPIGETYERSIRLQFPATNNEAEYEALLHGLRLALEMQVDNLEVFNDSQLVTGHVNGSYETRDPTMASYLVETQRLARLFSRFSITQVPRAQNASADALAKAASARGLEETSMTEPIAAPTIPSCGVVETRTPPNWMEEILRFKIDGTEPDNPTTGRRLRRTQAWYSVVGGKLYRRGFSQPLLLCLAPPEANTVLAELHEGICGEHIGGRTLAFKALRQGYYWPTMRRDAASYVQQCQPCQQHARLQHQPVVPLNPMEIAWPFAQWGLDLLGPFPPASGQRRFLIVGVDYFTKWVEAEPLASITEKQVQSFTWKNIITRFWIPRSIITDNGVQFNNAKFKAYCSSYGIQLKFSSMARPQTNGQAEVMNQAIL